MKTTITRFLAILVLAMLVTNIATAATFYIDPDKGDNANDGLSAAKPKRDWSAVKIESGNTYLQKAGTTWRGTIQFSKVNKVRLSKYGEGPLPKLTNSKPNQDWKFDVEKRCYWQEADRPRWLVLEDGKVLRRVMDNKKKTTEFPMPPGTFSLDPALKRLYYAPSSGKAADHLVEVPFAQTLIRFQDSSEVEIDHLEIYGFAVHGIVGWAVKNSRFHDLVIHDGGGGNDFCGNGIEISGPSSDCEMDHCTAWQIFDSALSPQSYGGPHHIERVKIHHNKIATCGMNGIEISTHYHNAQVTGITVTDNEVTDTGYGWSGNRGATAIVFGAKQADSGKTEGPERTFSQGIISRNKITRSLRGGVFVHRRCDVVIADNAIDGAGKGFGVGFVDESRTIGKIKVENNRLSNLAVGLQIGDCAAGAVMEMGNQFKSVAMERKIK